MTIRTIFLFYKEKLISKGKNKFPRIISIPTNRDKLVLKSMSVFLSSIYIEELKEELVHTKISKVCKDLESKEYDTFIKIDIINFYPTIVHEILLKFIKRKTRKKEFINLLEKAITQNTLDKSSRLIPKYTSKKGVPQGLSISNILASIYFLEIDKKYSTIDNFSYYRYVDDILILCKDKEADNIYKKILDDINNIGLETHPLEEGSQKTSKGKINDIFHFLGYKLSDELISVRVESYNNLCNSIINIFTQFKHSNVKDLDIFYWKLNLRITGCKYEDKKFGWMFFFSQIDDLTLLFRLDKFIESLCNKFNIKDITKIKKFIRTYYEIRKNRTNTNYIPNFSTYTVEMKRQILDEIFKIKKLNSFSNDSIEKKFDYIIHKNIKAMEKDIQIDS